MGPRAVVVLGFHRSGTSMLTRLLNLLGVDLGPADELLGADANDNVRGYWEPKWMIELNDELLAAQGGVYAHPPALPHGWEHDPQLEPLRRRAREHLAASFGDTPLWGIKDPRLCLTLPFWQPLLAEHGVAVSYVLALRSPVESAASMLRRGTYGGTDEAHWGRVWLEYTGRSLDATAGGERTLVFYDDLITGGAAELRRVADSLSIPWPSGEAGAVLEDAIESGLRTHVSTLLDVGRDERLPAAARSAYLSLCAAADTRARRPQLADALEHVAVALWEQTRRESRAPDHRAQLAEALGEIQRSDLDAAALRDELETAQAQVRRLAADAAEARVAGLLATR
jgi:hypothetical protein